MNDDENNLKKNKNYVREKIFLDNEEKEQENKKEEAKFAKNFVFNLDFQKIMNTQNNQTKISTELNKLLNFVKERYFYKDINGKRITPKGELLPTPFQKLKKINDEIKSYYEKKMNKKNSPLIIKNYKNKKIFIKNNLTLSNINKRKNKNYFSSHKFAKDLERVNYNKYINNSKTLKNMGIQNNMTLFINNNNCYPYNKINFSHNNGHKVSLSENFKKGKKKYFSDLLFNQINFWKTKILYLNSTNAKNREDKNYENNSRYDNYIIEYKKRYNENNFLNNKLYKFKEKQKHNSFNKNFKSLTTNNLYTQKSKDFSNNFKNYDLIQFNMNQLIKPDKYNKDKLVLNMRKAHTKIKKRKLMENKTINVNMDNVNFFDLYKNS